MSVHSHTEERLGHVWESHGRHFVESSLDFLSGLLSGSFPYSPPFVSSERGFAKIEKLGIQNPQEPMVTRNFQTWPQVDGTRIEQTAYFLSWPT